MLISAAACGNSPAEQDTGVIAVSVSADWLSERLGDAADGIIVGTETDTAQYSVDLAGLRDEGYVIRKESGDTVIFGKTEDGLRKYIGEACGVYPEIVNKKNDRMIALEPINEDDERYPILGVEGFTISVNGGNLYITGGTLRGCLYGVYEFLESYGGWRFLYDYKSFSGTLREDSHAIDYLYESDHIDIPEGTSDTQTPSFELRDNYCGQLTEQTPDYTVKLKGMNDGTYGKTKYNCYGVAKMTIHGISRHGFCQSYFNEQNVTMNSPQPCFTDPDFIDASIEYFVGRTQSLIDEGQYVHNVRRRI